MFFNKYLNKHYMKYIVFFIIGFLALIAVDYAQLYIPEFLGNIISHLQLGDTSFEFTASDLAIIFKPTIIDSIMGNTIPTVSGIGAYILGTVIVAGIMCLGRMIWRFSVFYAARKIESDIRHDMFLKSERLSQRYFHLNPVGNIMSWFTNDLDTVEEYLGWGFIMLIDAIFLSIFAMAKMVYLNYQLGDYRLAIFTVLPLVLIIIWGAIAEKIMDEKWSFRQKEFDHLYDYSQENFTGIRVIKAFVKERQEIKAFAKEAKRNQDANISFIKIAVIFDVIIELIIAVIFTLILAFGSYLVYKGTMDVGNLVTFIGYFDTLIWPMIALGQIVSMKSRAKASLRRIAAFLDQEEEIHDKENAISLADVKGKIIVKNFTFRYPTADHDNLIDVNFEIKPGEKIGVVGKIGSGKTTIMNILMRLYNVEEGHVFIDDKDIMDIKLKSIRGAIAYVPQDNFLFSDKISNNIAFYDKNAPMDKVIEASKFSDVYDNIVEFKDGFDTITGERGVTLSGGQKQRVSIARAFIKDAPIMILDDSVSAVDIKTEENIINNISKYREGKTTILIASRVSTVMHMDRILVMRKRVVEAFDTPENLMKTSPTFQKMVYLQQLEEEVKGGKE